MNTKRNTYRASKHVRLGVPDEHAYNMFLSIMQMMYRLGLWEMVLKENQLHTAWHRMVNPMRTEHLRRKHGVQKAALKASPYRAS